MYTKGEMQMNENMMGGPRPQMKMPDFSKPFEEMTVMDRVLYNIPAIMALTSEKHIEFYDAELQRWRDFDGSSMDIVNCKFRFKVSENNIPL